MAGLRPQTPRCRVGWLAQRAQRARRHRRAGGPGGRGAEEREAAKATRLGAGAAAKYPMSLSIVAFRFGLRMGCEVGGDPGRVCLDVFVQSAYELLDELR